MSTERLKQAILGGCTTRPHQLFSLHPSSTLSYDYVLSITFTIAANLTGSTKTGQTPTVSEMYGLMSFADEREQ